MRIRLWVVTTIAASMILMGCGGPKHFEDEHAKYDPTMSKAMNIALLTGLTHAERGPLKDSVLTSSDKESGMSGAAMANLAAGSFDLLSGGGGLGVVTSFMFKTFQPEWENHVFAWMPKDLANDEAAAAMVMCEIMQEAMQEAAPSNAKLIGVKDCYKFRAFSDAQRSYIALKDPLLGLHSYEVQVGVPELVAPTHLVSEDSYYWSYMKTNSDTSPRIKLNRGWELMSSYLPSWVYIYIAPNRETGEPAHFLNKGENLYFIKPI